MRDRDDEQFPPFVVTSWDDDTIPAATREDAVALVKSILSGWMNPDDMLGWEDKAPDTGLPRLAWVCDSVGQPTDAWAAILRPDSPEPQERKAARLAAHRIDQSRFGR